MPSNSVSRKNVPKETNRQMKNEKTYNQIPLIEYGDLLGVEQACEYLNISKHTLYKWVEMKKIPHYKMSNKKVMFNKVKLSAWLEELSVG